MDFAVGYQWPCARTLTLVVPYLLLKTPYLWRNPVVEFIVMEDDAAGPQGHLESGHIRCYSPATDRP